VRHGQCAPARTVLASYSFGRVQLVLSPGSEASRTGTPWVPTPPRSPGPRGCPAPTSTAGAAAARSTSAATARKPQALEPEVRRQGRGLFSAHAARRDRSLSRCVRGDPSTRPARRAAGRVLWLAGGDNRQWTCQDLCRARLPPARGPRQSRHERARPDAVHMRPARPHGLARRQRRLRAKRSRRGAPDACPVAVLVPSGVGPRPCLRRTFGMEQSGSAREQAWRVVAGGAVSWGQTPAVAVSDSARAGRYHRLRDGRPDSHRFARAAAAGDRGPACLGP